MGRARYRNRLRTSTGRTRVLRGAAWRRAPLRRGGPRWVGSRMLPDVGSRMALPAPALTPAPDMFAGIRLIGMPTSGGSVVDPATLVTAAGKVEDDVERNAVDEPTTAEVSVRRPRRRRSWGVPVLLLAAVAVGTGGAAVWGGHLAPDPVPRGYAQPGPAMEASPAPAAKPSATVTPIVEQLPAAAPTVAPREPTAEAEPPAREHKARRESRRRSRRARAAAAQREAAEDAVDEPGYLSVAAEPYATVYVDGRRVGDTPLLEVELPAGTYSVRGVAADGRVASAVVTVRAGSTVRQRLSYGE